MTLLHRYFSNCSCFASFTSQLVSFKKTFLLNSYPISFVDNCIHSYLNKIHSPAPKVSLAPKKILYFCLPFTGQHSLQIRTQISKLCSGTLPPIKLRFVFRLSLRLVNFFPFKDRVPKSLKSYLVYSLKYQRCSSLYISQTGRLLHNRISDHLGISAITGKSALTLPPQVFCHTKGTQDTRFLHVTLMFYLPELTTQNFL